jgi:hypothetical protein
MDARVEALEGGMAEVRSTLVDIQTAMRDGHASLIAMMEKHLGKRVVTSEGEIPVIHITSGKKDGVKPESSGDPATEFRHAVRKVELPLFNGEDPAGWISRAEIYFRVQETTPEVKVRLAQICMEGPTIHFFNSLLGEDDELTWEKLKESLLGRYGGHGEGDVYEQLTELKQGGTVDEYITEFEYLIAQIPKLPDKQFLSYFLHGLKSEIKGKVRSLAALGDISRTKLLHVTRAVERETKGSGSNMYRGPKPSHGSNRPSSNGSGRSGSDWVMVKGRDGDREGGAKSNNFGPKGERSAQSERRHGGSRDRGFTRLSYQEFMDRKEKGLCFKCKGPFHPMHQCPERQLKVLVYDRDYEDEAEARVLAVEVDESDEEDGGELCVLDLNHLAFEDHKTVKFQGQICGVPVLVLVDCGASHNFVSQKLVQMMGWPVEETPMMNIKLGDVFRAQSKGEVQGLEMSIGDFKLTPTMHLFELGGIDVVLGMEWLKTLGDMIVNWHHQTMSFWKDKKWVTLKRMDRRES